MTEEQYEILMPLGDEFGVRLDNHEGVIDSITASTPPGVSLVEWVRSQIPLRFRVVGRPPRWLQEEEWPVGNEGPLLFIGQIDVEPASNLPIHDTTSFFVFYDQAVGESTVVTQQG